MRIPSSSIAENQLSLYFRMKRKNPQRKWELIIDTRFQQTSERLKGREYILKCTGREGCSSE